jgi:hypothetical protein
MVSNKSPQISTNVQRQPPPWTTAMIVPEVLHYNFHALEDEDMIRWLGREIFVDTCINGPLGWQDKVSVCIYLIAPSSYHNINPHNIITALNSCCGRHNA